MCKPFLTEKRFNYTQNIILPESKKTLPEPQRVENIFNKHFANITKKKKNHKRKPPDNSTDNIIIGLRCYPEILRQSS